MSKHEKVLLHMLGYNTKESLIQKALKASSIKKLRKFKY